MLIARLEATVLIALLLGASTTSAQTNVESNAGVQLDFLNPGARSLALGGAFVGLADDATAALTNPAGLRFISRKEFSAEGRYWSFATPFTSGGRLSGSVTQQGIDVTSGLTTGESRESALSASFLSFVYPSTRWAVAVYRQQLASFKYRAESRGPFVQFGNTDARLNPYRATLEVDIARYGISSSYKLGQNASIGVGMYMYDFKLASETRRYAFDPNRQQFYAAPNFSTTPVRVESQEGSDHRFGINVGISATPHPKFQMGAVYRQGADFAIRTTDVAGSQVASADGTFTIPEIFGVGFLFKPLDQVRVTVDYNRVRYSQIAKTFSLLFAPLPGFTALAQDFKVDDANEIHAGLEYLLLNLTKPVAFRVGSWFDPDHAVRFEPANLQTADSYNSAVFRRGKDVVHGTFGAGIAFGAVEVNAAGDISARTKSAAISTVVRF